MQPVSPVLPSAWLIAFAEVTYAKDQPEYLPLPALLSSDPTRTVTTRWRLSWRERLKLLFTGHLFLQVNTFGCPLQPVRLTVDEPKAGDCL